MSDEKRKLCCVISLKSRDRPQLLQDAAVIVDLVRRDSGGEYEILMRTPDNDYVAFLFNSDKPLAVLRANFERSPSTRNGDGYIVFELGNEVLSTAGFTRAATWLQRH